MAAFQHGVVTSFLRDTTPPLNPRTKSIFLVSCVSTSFPRRSTGRKNHLRPKNLKTLITAALPKLPQQNPANPYASSPSEEFQEAEKSENSEAASESAKNGEESNEVEASVSDGIGLEYISRGFWTKESTLFKFSLVASLVFQAVWAVGFFIDNDDVSNGNDDDDDDDDKSSVTEFRGDEEGDSRVKVSLNGTGEFVDELEVERKIEEIRVLAREAREKERKNLNGDGEEHSKSVIEEEVDGKLVKLRKKLEKSRATSLENSTKESKATKKVSDDEFEANGALLFKKKHKYRGFDGNNPIEKPKGFYSSESDEAKGDEEKQLEFSSKEPETKETTTHVVEDDKQKVIVEPTESPTNSKKMAMEERGVREQRKRKVTDGSEADAWWLNLPYVLAVVMRRGRNGEDGEGFYTLKSMPNAEDHQLPHIVAFEDRADANNFCYLLQSFFDDLEDFSAQVVPLKAEELQSAAEAYATRAVVVRRGQLRLFAGQPLSDVETAVRGIINEC